MAGVVVVGGGLGGLAVAARLAKLGHDVTVVERRDRLGGAIAFVERDGFRWDAGPAATALPAALRDLFRKSGRPLDSEVTLLPLEPFREHRFADGSRVALSSASRAAQAAAVDTGLGSGLGRAWVDHLQSFSEPWELLRRHVLERPLQAAPDPDLRRLLRSRRSLYRGGERAFADPRLRRMAAYQAVAAGRDPRQVPAWLGLLDYLDLKFGVWTAPGGLAELTGALARRLDVRGVTVLTATRATDLLTGNGGPRAVATDAGDIDADVVVCAADPRTLPAVDRRVRPGPRVAAPEVTHLGLAGPVPALPAEVVLHGDRGCSVVRTRGTAPPGGAAWTVVRHGRHDTDPVAELGRWGLDVAPSVRVRVDRPPGDVDGAPYGAAWRRGDLGRRLSTQTDIPGVYVAGAHAALLGTVPLVALTAAVVADLVGPASPPRTGPSPRR
jgi:UDP-galactopyranose mutase